MDPRRLGAFLAVAATLGGQVACGDRHALDAKFVLHIEQGWSCPPNGYVGLDKHSKVRVEVTLPQAQIQFPDYVNHPVFDVYTGKHLDDPDSNGCDGTFDGEDVELDYLYVATDGEAERFQDGPDLGITVDQLVLHPDPRALGVDGDRHWDKLDDVTVDHFTFPAFPEQ